MTTQTQTGTNGNGAAPEAEKQQGRALAKAPLVSGGGIAAIVPRDIEQAYRLAQAIASANMAPQSYDRDANKIMVGIMHGMEVGLPPMAALQSIAVINGMPTIWGDGALGLVRSSGLLEDIEERFEGEGEGLTAVCTVRRTGQRTPVTRSFSVAEAKRAQLWTKKGPWQQYPQRMLQMRARSWALRDGFADVLRGLGISEEVQDMGNLAQQADGSYAPEPAMPRRSDFKGASNLPEAAAVVDDEDAVADLELYDAHGEQLLTTTDPAEWVDRFEQEVHAAAVAKQVEALREGNSPLFAKLPPALAEQARATLASREKEIDEADCAAAAPGVTQAVDWQARKDALWKQAQAFDAAKPLRDWFQTDGGVAALKAGDPEIYSALMAEVNARLKTLRK